MLCASLCRPLTDRLVRRHRPRGLVSPLLITEAERLIQAGQVDEARELLRQQGGVASAKLLSETYAREYGPVGIPDGGVAASLF